jgi:diguanylate cyclase (GGDEF)-like protein/PAS domain S-box-containing protein
MLLQEDPLFIVEPTGIVSAVHAKWHHRHDLKDRLGCDISVGDKYDSLVQSISLSAPLLATDFKAKMHACLEGSLQAFVFEFPVVREGEVFWYLMTAGALLLEGLRHIALDLKNIDSQRVCELNAHLAFTSADKTLAGLVICDARSPGMPLIYVNEAIQRITGYSAGEMVGRNCNFLQADERNQASLISSAELRAGIQANVVTTTALKNYRKDGSVFVNEVTIFPVFNELGEALYFVGLQRDLTTEKLAKATFNASRERDRIGLRFANVGVFEFDPTTNKMQSQDYCHELLGLHTDTELTFELLKSSIMAEDRERFDESLKSCLAGSSGIDLEYRVVWPEGDVKWLHTKGHIFERREGNGLRLVCMSQDVTQRRIVDRHIRYVAEHDALTGLPNRAVMRDRCEQVLSVAQRNNACVGLLFIDLDRFKEINDTHGHQIGDEFLKEVAARLRNSVRAADTVCRQSGDEFVVILHALPNTLVVDLCVRKIRDALSQPYSFGGIDFEASASIGIACSPSDGTTTDELLRHADMAMYSAKRKGGGHYEFYSQAVGKTIQDIQTLRSELTSAVARHELTVFYQPQFHAAAGKLVGLEALLRWRHPKRGLLAPSEFLPVAESSGDLLFAIEEWVIYETLQQRNHWLKHGFLPQVPVFLNISANYFQDKYVLSKLAAHLRSSDMGPSQIGLEIPESAIWGDGADSAQGVATVRELDRIGVGLAIDNFGQGTSSVTQLAQCPVDCIKLEKTMMSRIVQDRASLAAFSAMLALGKSLHLQVVAQAIEVSQQARVASRLGCNTLQGNLFCSPVNSIELQKLMSSSAFSNALTIH